jgi:hypothetical protein
MNVQAGITHLHVFSIFSEVDYFYPIFSLA